MKVYQHLALGAFHPVFCEDFCVCYELGDDWTVLAVLDGCSGGTHSHFASSLLGKIIHKVSRQVPYWAYQDPVFDLSKVDIATLGERFVQHVFEELCQAKQQLFLEIDELASTCLLGLYHRQRRQAWINSSGDGVVVVNEQIDILDQDDKPNYMAYHHLLPASQWLEEETITQQFDKVYNLALSTDGILSFEGEATIEVLPYLLQEDSHSEWSTMLRKKCRILERDYELRPNDDLGMVRLWNP